jgi:hypothetical protein
MKANCQVILKYREKEKGEGLGIMLQVFSKAEKSKISE